MLTALATAGRVRTLTPGTNLDEAWQTAINLTHRAHLRWGPEVDFTYGPWGRLDYPVAVSPVSIVLSLLFGIFSVALLWFAGRRALAAVLPRPWAAVATTAVVLLSYPADDAADGISGALVLACIIFTIQFLLAGHVEVRSAWVPAFAAGAGALLVQVKISEGVIVCMAAAIGAVCAPSHAIRRSIEAVATFALVTSIAWLGAGQRLTDFPRWLLTSADIARFYTDAMALEQRPFIVSYALIAAFVLVTLGYLLAVARSTMSRRARMGVIVMSLVATYFGFRQGTTRHDVHESAFWLLLLATLLALVGTGRSRTFRITALAFAVALGGNPGTYLRPNIDRSRLSTSVELALSDSYRTQSLAAARGAAQRLYAVSPVLLARMGHRPVQVDGYAATLPWAYHLTWRPAPIFQSYAAYSAGLDQLDASWLRDSPADQAVLRPPSTAIDGRNSLWDPPRYLLSEICHFRVAAASGGWMLLTKSANRCGARTQVEQRHVSAGERIAVPRSSPSSITIMSFAEDEPSLLSRLGRVLYKPLTPLNATADGTTYRLPRALSGGPLVLNVPDVLRWGRSFGGGTDYRTVSFNRPGVVRFSTLTLM